MSFGTDPFGFGGGVGYNPQSTSALISAAQGSAQQAYQQGMLQYYNDQLAFQKAQQAFTDTMTMGSQYGYMPSIGGSSTGNMFSWPANPTPPFQIGAHTDSSGNFQPTGYAGMPTLQEQQMQYSQLQGQAQNTAAATGMWQQPIPEQWTQQMPTWDQLSTYMQQQNPNWNQNAAKSLVQQLVNESPDQFHGNYSLQQLSQADLQRIIQAGGGMPSTPTMALQSMYGGYGTPQQGQQTLAAQQQAAGIAAQQAGMTGYYNAPSMYTPGTYVQDPTSQAYYQVQSNGQLTPVQGLPQGVSAIQGPAGIGGTAGQQGTSTLQAQQQQFTQGLQTAQFGLSVQQQQQQAANQYLSLLSQLQGPADYGQYLKVLGSTPQGLQGLVGAAAGNYLPGGGTSGQAPQAQTLQNLVGAATGYASGGAGANAATSGTGQATGQQAGGGGTASLGGQNYQDFLATAQGLPPPSQIAPQSFNYLQPSQKQMLGSMYANIGYSPTDINSMYQMSLPKYASGSAAGNMRLV